MPVWTVPVLLAFIPGLFWVAYFYHQDIYEPEPKWFIIKVFFLGALSVLPAAGLEKLILLFLPQQQIPEDHLSLLAFCFLVIGLLEEISKYLAVYYLMYKNPEFDEQPMDGLLYGVTAGLGFAALENFFYAANFGLATGAVRAVVTSLAHASFSGIMGYNLGLARLLPSKSVYFIVKGLVLAVLLHGLYDFVFLSRILPWITTAPLIFLMIWQLFRRFQAARLDSNFRGRK